MTESERLMKLEPPAKKMRMVLDTDTFNEEDDQFALTYAYKCSQAGLTDLLAVYAAPFTHSPSTSPAEGMEQSYNEIIHILNLNGKTDTDGFVFRGTPGFMNGVPAESPAALDLIEKALASPKDDPLYVVAIGAVTNVACAIALCPEITEHIVLVWLGGTSTDKPVANEYNLEQDPAASRIVLDCGVPLVQLPCSGVVDKFRTTVSELERFIDGKSGIAEYLTSLIRKRDNGRAFSKVIWDVTAVGYVVHPEWLDSKLIHTPRLTEEPKPADALLSLACYKNSRPRLYWTHDYTRHFMRTVTNIDRDRLYYDLFSMITG